jgi:hypothetical protein
MLSVSADHVLNPLHLAFVYSDGLTPNCHVSQYGACILEGATAEETGRIQ